MLRFRIQQADVLNRVRDADDVGGAAHCGQALNVKHIVSDQPKLQLLHDPPT